MACARTAPVEPPQTTPSGTPSSSSASGSPPSSSDAAPSAGIETLLDAGAVAWSPAPLTMIDGPHEELSLDAGRPIFFAMPRSASGELRLVGHLHGMCGPPSYACGKWIGAGTDVGVMVCPTGNARCGDPATGPASWEAPSWMELVGIMDKDLESAVAKVEAKHRRRIRRDGAILTGYSRGAYAAPVIARMHPGRWPYLVLIEANAPLSGASLRTAGVHAVALVAGEQGAEITGMRKTQASLESSGFPSKLIVMRRTGHLYSDDMEYVMHEALTFVLSHEPTLDSGLPR